MAMNSTSENILFYDGSCGFCNKSVYFILKNERTSSIRFTPLQGETAKSYNTTKHLDPQHLDSIYFLKDGQFYSKSSAALAILPHLKWYFQPLRIVVIIPTPWRDRFYDFIAKRRKKWFKEYCHLPSPEERQRFIH